MPSTSADFLQFAENCLLMDCEIGFRNSVSRSYYAMYHEALTNLTALPKYESNHHSSLIGYLKNKSENKHEPFDAFKMKSLGYRLDQQRRARHEADYDLNDCEVSKDGAESAIEAAKLFFQDWSALLQDKAS